MWSNIIQIATPSTTTWVICMDKAGIRLLKISEDGNFIYFILSLHLFYFLNFFDVVKHYSNCDSIHYQMSNLHGQGGNPSFENIRGRKWDENFIYFILSLHLFYFLNFFDVVKHYSNCDSIHYQMSNLHGHQYFTSILYCSKFTIWYQQIKYITNF